MDNFELKKEFIKLKDENVSSGIYFYILETIENKIIHKMNSLK